MIPLRDTVPSRRTPVAVLLLILVNAALFAVELTLPERELTSIVNRYGIVPSAWAGFAPREYLHDPRLALAFAAALVGSQFLHAGWLHIAGNMWTLWIFGDNVEDRMGPLRFLVFYLACGVAAGLTHLYFHPASEVPTIGASGAIAGVMGSYFVLYPRAKVITLVPFFFLFLVELPAVVYLGFWFLAQLFSGTLALSQGEQAGGIAFLAHGGGFVCGIATFWIFLRRGSGRRA
jgi:membrane associated rhomboid family serine protease